MIMSPDTPLFGRITLGTNRVSLGRGGTTLLFVRALEQIRKLRVGDEAVIQIELSRAPLPDASTFDRAARMEQMLAERLINDPDAPSPWPGITVGTVTLAMSSPEYEAYNAIASDPAKRIGLSQDEIQTIIDRYAAVFPDCISHFPKWID